MFLKAGAPEIGTDAPTLSLMDGSADVASAEDGMVQNNSQMIIANNGKAGGNVSQNTICFTYNIVFC